MSSSFFNWLDYVFISLTLIFCIVGLIRGFTKDFLSTCAWFVSGFITVYVYLPIQNLILQNFEMPVLFAKSIAICAAYSIILMILLAIIGFLSRKVKNTEVLSGIDRALGALLGFVRGILVSVAIGFVILILNVQDAKYECIEQSKLTPYLLFIAHRLMPEASQLARLSKDKLDLNQLMEGTIASGKKLAENQEQNSNQDGNSPESALGTEESLQSINELMNNLSRHLSNDDNKNRESLDALRTRGRQRRHSNLRKKRR